MDQLLHLDVETHSLSDLTKIGSTNYFKHPSTDIYNMAYGFGPDGQIKVWRRCEPPPSEICDHIRAGGKVVAWYDAFERDCFDYLLGPVYGFPTPGVEQWIDAPTIARVQGLPGKLEKASKAPWFDLQKDMEGHRLMMKLCKPDASGKIPFPTPEEYDRHDGYCATDVEAERQITYWCGSQEITDFEADRVIPMDRDMNDAGFRIDLDLLDALIELAEEAKPEIDARFRAITGVEKTSQLPKFKLWLAERGVYKPGDKLGKNEIADLLHDEVSVTGEVREALELRSWGSKTSLSKLQVAAHNSEDGILRRQFLLYGAGQTGRYAAHVWQPQNIIRDVLPEEAVPLLLARDVKALEKAYGPLPALLPKALRLLIIARKGKILHAGDYSQVESRLGSWTSRQDDKVKAFIDGRDLYVENAVNMFDLPQEEATGSYRQLGKVGELGCIFGGGYRAVVSMARNYGIRLDQKEAETIKVKWRKAAPKTVMCWDAFERAARRAIRNPGEEIRVDKKYCRPDIHYLFSEERDILWAILPSGRRLFYHRPRFTANEYDGTDLDVDSFVRGAWRIVSLYGGMLFQHCIQAMARDIAIRAMVLLFENQLSPRLTIHDEVVAEGDAAAAEEDHALFLDLMTDTDEWAKPAGDLHLPIGLDHCMGFRYQKV